MPVVTAQRIVESMIPLSRDKYPIAILAAVNLEFHTQFCGRLLQDFQVGVLLAHAVNFHGCVASLRVQVSSWGSGSGSLRRPSTALTSAASVRSSVSRWPRRTFLLWIANL